MEFLVNMTTEVPTEQRRPRSPTCKLRLWTLPGHGRSLGHRQAPGSGPMRDMLRSLPMASRLTTETTPATGHPNDPAGEVLVS